MNVQEEPQAPREDSISQGVQREGTWKARNLAASKETPSSLSQQTLLSKPFFLGTGNGIPFLSQKVLLWRLEEKPCHQYVILKRENTMCMYASVHVCEHVCFSCFSCYARRLWSVQSLLGLSGQELAPSHLFVPGSLPDAIHKDNIHSNSFKRPVHYSVHQDPQL